MIIPNIILAFAQYTIYRVNMLCKFKPKQFNFFLSVLEFKQDLIMNLTFLEKRNIIIISTVGYEISLSNANWFQWSANSYIVHVMSIWLYFV